MLKACTMEPELLSSVWVFHGTGGRFTSAVFTKKDLAEKWISQHKLSGVLTEYPLDVGVYDWAIANNSFKVKKEVQEQAEFIQKFTTASQDHYHYENGELD
jgi:hypothetical protein